MVENAQSTSNLKMKKRYIQETRYSQLSFVRWISLDKSSYEIFFICSSITPSTGQLYIFLEAAIFFFFYI